MTLNVKTSDTDQEKIRIASNFILTSPPKEINDVLKDLRILINDDYILKKVISSVLPQYNKNQLTPVKIESFKLNALITDYNDLGSNRFYDPRTKKSFEYDHLRNEATDFEKWESDSTSEIYRKALEETSSKYLEDHYRQGISCVYSHRENENITLTLCIESHQFKLKDFWSGKWRSVWSILFAPTSNVAKIEGIIKVQVHYFEDGNIHFITSNELKEFMPITSEYQIANEFMKFVEKSETEYQVALFENYEAMSNITFKTLRRLLPRTRTKIDWGNILIFKYLGSDLKSYC